MRTTNDRRMRAMLLASTLVVAGALWLTPFARAGAQQLSDIPAAFVDVGIGARSMGMGGAVAANELGPESLFWNPAGIAPVNGVTGFSVTHGEQMGLVPYSAASASHTLGSGLTLGIGVIQSGDDVLTETTLLLAVAREVVATPWCAARAIDAGVGLRGRRASYGNNTSTEDQVTGSASGFGVDVGALIPASEAVTVALSGRDVFSTLTWESSASGSYDENVPGLMSLGLRAVPHGAVGLEVDVERSLGADNPTRVLAGIEASLWNVAELRGGYRKALPPGDLEEYTLGAGASIDAASMLLRVDFSYLFGQLDNTMRFSLGVEL